MKLRTYDIPIQLDPMDFGEDRKGGFLGLLGG